MTTIASIRDRGTITVAEAAEVLEIGRDAAYAGVRDGTIPSLRLGRVIRVPVPALLRVLGVEPEGDQHRSGQGETGACTAPALATTTVPGDPQHGDPTPLRLASNSPNDAA